MVNLQQYPVLIVGLGNPGKSYERTRHNIGFRVVKEIARQLGVCLQNKKEFLGEYSQGQVTECKVMLLLPTTYMNLSGESVKRCCDFFKITSDRVLILCDDVALEFGKLRIREKGSSGGHNGLKSIEMYLGTHEYCRLKIGVGKDNNMELADFVLASFSPEESDALENVVKEAAEVALIWATQGCQVAIKQVDLFRKKKVKTESKDPAVEEKKNIKED